MNSNCGYPLYWRGCYTDSFDLIAPESYAHPAKMAPALNFRILEHLEELGLLKPNDTILDPMGGTGLTAITAGAKGYKAITVELEEKFVNFQKQNKQYAERKLYKQLDWQIIQGDSRKLSELLTEKGLVSVTSPPYAEAQTGGGIMKDGIIPKSFESKKRHPSGRSSVDWIAGRTYSPDMHGQSPGQIGNLKDTPLKVVTSPPYGDSLNEKKNTTSNLKREERLITAGYQPKEFMGGTARNASVEDGLRYSQDPANLGNLPDKPFVSVISPPYEAQGFKCDENPANLQKREDKRREQFPMRPPVVPGHYGDTYDNIGNSQGESYLSAMLQVYQEIAKVSDVLAIVIKNPTRNKQLRRLDLDTIKILELAGWTIHCQHRALLFEELEQADMFNGSQKKVKGRMSFFKRLSWQNGQPVASWEDVIIACRKRY